MQCAVDVVIVIIKKKELAMSVECRPAPCHLRLAVVDRVRVVLPWAEPDENPTHFWEEQTPPRTNCVFT